MSEPKREKDQHPKLPARLRLAKALETYAELDNQEAKLRAQTVNESGAAKFHADLAVVLEKKESAGKDLETARADYLAEFEALKPELAKAGYPKSTILPVSDERTDVMVEEPGYYEETPATGDKPKPLSARLKSADPDYLRKVATPKLSIALAALGCTFQDIVENAPRLIARNVVIAPPAPKPPEK